MYLVNGVKVCHVGIVAIVCIFAHGLKDISYILVRLGSILFVLSTFACLLYGGARKILNTICHLLNSLFSNHAFKMSSYRKRRHRPSSATTQLS
jgi:hypothetical protein